MSVITIPSRQTGSLSAVASIVHDLRNPLATIHGGAEMLAGAHLPQEQVQRIARNIGPRFTCANCWTNSFNVQEVRNMRGGSRPYESWSTAPLTESYSG